MALVAVAWTHPGTGYTRRGVRMRTICRGAPVRIVITLWSDDGPGKDKSAS